MEAPVPKGPRIAEAVHNKVMDPQDMAALDATAEDSDATEDAEQVNETNIEEAGQAAEVEAPEADAPDAEAEDVQPEPEINLVELPDGRKVTPEAAVEQYKKLQADYTRKSQELAEIKKSTAESPEPKPWQQDGYEPQSWQEVMEAATEEAINRLKQQQSAQEEQERVAQEQLDIEINALKKTDPNIDVDAVLKFANDRTAKLGIKYNGFTAAYYDFKQLKQHEKLVEKRVVEKQKQRAADPVSDGQAPGSSAMEYPEGLDLHEKARLAWQRKTS